MSPSITLTVSQSRAAALAGGAPCEAPWAAAYAKRHADILAGSAPPRFLVGVAAVSGLADRVLAHIAQFYWAVLSGRAIQLMEWASVAALATALLPRCVQWQLPRDFHPRAAWRPLFELDVCPECLYNATILNDTWGSIPTSLSRFSMTRLYKDRDLAQWPPELLDIPHVLDTGIGGKTRMLWANPHHAAALKAIAPLENATRTAWDYLFTPTAAVREAMEPYERELAGAYVIAIQIRTGDEAMVPDEPPRPALADFGEQVGAFFRCAENLTARVAPPGLPVRWFLASDSIELRRAAIREYGDLVVTNTVTRSQHINGNVFGEGSSSVQGSLPCPVK